MLRISTINGHNRMSTQELLLTIEEAVRNGETEFQIAASGQHDIGGPLWNENGQTIHFTVTNPGQRVGSMCLPNTIVTVDGSAPADAGWLNSGGTVVVLGDAGDTAGHCAASGKIYICGRSGTRSGSLMKHDPEMPPPELWILNSTGSFSFEFMGGGTAVVCGYESQTLPSVLGERPGAGMVGGVIYFRGPHGDLPPGVSVQSLDEQDQKWLEQGLDEFLAAIGQSKLKRELSFWKHWRKLIPASDKEQETVKSLRQYHLEDWPEQGLFGDVLQDDASINALVNTGDNRLNVPVWSKSQNCIDCRNCLKICPRAAVLRRQDNNSATPEIIYSVNAAKCIGCGFCVAICPKALWTLQPVIND